MARILHIEDNSSNRKVVRYLLRATPHDLIEAVNGQQGLEMAMAQKPDLVLLDIQLPIMSGYEVAERLKADPGERRGSGSVPARPATGASDARATM